MSLRRLYYKGIKTLKGFKSVKLMCFSTRITCGLMACEQNIHIKNESIRITEKGTADGPSKRTRRR